MEAGQDLWLADGQGGGAAEGGQEGDRVCFKGEEELVVALLNARW